jgi:hypothetical protein
MLTFAALWCAQYVIGDYTRSCEPRRAGATPVERVTAMSDGEDFLARWSRLKHAAAREREPVASPSKHADAQPQAGMAVVAPQSERVVDLPLWFSR